MSGMDRDGRAIYRRLVMTVSTLAALAAAAGLLFGDGSTSHAGGSGVEVISAGGFHTCAVKDGDAWCWGTGGNGRLGNGSTAQSTSPVPVFGPNAGVTDVSAGVFHTCAVKQGGAWCWGFGEDGQLGNNDTEDSLVPVPVEGLDSGVTAISAGQHHSCAVKDGNAWCWGSGSSGSLGNGTTDPSPVPVPVCSPETVAPCSVEIGNVLEGVTAISAGQSHTCAIAEGSAFCWGFGGQGRLGTADTESEHFPAPVSGLDSGVTAISAGETHTCAVADGEGWCWGLGNAGQLGAGAVPQTTVPVSVTEFDSDVTAIGAQAGHSCGVKEGGAWCWGRGQTGQLGDGEHGAFHLSNVPVPVVGLGSGVTGIASGNTQNCAIMNGGAFCWGRNTTGQLGTETSEICDVDGSEFDCSTVPVQVTGMPPLGQPPTGVWGDADCDGTVAIGDALKVARHLLGLSVSQTQPCPLIADDALVDDIPRIWGDADCDGSVAIGDALKIARWLLGLSVSQEEGCPEIGTQVDVAQLSS